MTCYVLAAGGTGGHVYPMLAVAEALRASDPGCDIVTIGTAEGLESRLVPERGFELEIIPRVPFPRRPNVSAMKFPSRFRRAVRLARSIIRERRADVVVGFGGYVSTPVYVAARREGVPIVIHEANAKPGLANRLGARYTSHVGVAFPGAVLPHARIVGMPLRPEIEAIAQSTEVRAHARDAAYSEFGLDPHRPTVLVTGGSLGARRLNETVGTAVKEIVESGWQVLHIVGANGGGHAITQPHYVVLEYCNRMDLALAGADFAISRAGASTVSELTALSIPAVYIPYPVGNGEQRLNAAHVVDAGGALLVEDSRFTPEWVHDEVLPLLSDSGLRSTMRSASARVGIVDGTAQTLSLIRAALA